MPPLGSNSWITRAIASDNNDVVLHIVSLSLRTSNNLQVASIATDEHGGNWTEPSMH